MNVHNEFNLKYQNNSLFSGFFLQEPKKRGRYVCKYGSFEV